MLRGAVAFAVIGLVTVTVAIWIQIAAVPASRTAATPRPLPRSSPPTRVFTPIASASAIPLTLDEATAAPPTRESIERGASLYGWNGCVLCHGPQAEGLVGPRIAGTVLSLTAVQRQVRTPRNAYMPPFTPGQLSDEGIAAIYAFLQSLSED